MENKLSIHDKMLAMIKIYKAKKDHQEALNKWIDLQTNDTNNKLLILTCEKILATRKHVGNVADSLMIFTGTSIAFIISNFDKIPLLYSKNSIIFILSLVLMSSLFYCAIKYYQISIDATYDDLETYGNKLNIIVNEYDDNMKKAVEQANVSGVKIESKDIDYEKVIKDVSSLIGAKLSQIDKYFEDTTLSYKENVIKVTRMYKLLTIQFILIIISIYISLYLIKW